ncbi:hypothetical protein Tco_0407280 [Tanacetum coccineum]
MELAARSEVHMGTRRLLQEEVSTSFLEQAKSDYSPPVTFSLRHFGGVTLEKEHSKLFSKVNELELEVKKLAKSKEVVDPCKKYDVLSKGVDSLRCNADEALNCSKFKKISVVLDDMLSC